jgi:hypothetical protein
LMQTFRSCHDAEEGSPVTSTAATFQIRIADRVTVSKHHLP